MIGGTGFITDKKKQTQKIIGRAADFTSWLQGCSSLKQLEEEEEEEEEEALWTSNQHSY